MDYRIDPQDRARFKRCRREWDFASPHRRNLEPTERMDPPLPAALLEALAVYYYPGTWDWQHGLKQSLVHKALTRSLADADAAGAVDTGVALIDCYDAWASTVDDFAPVKIGHDVQGLVGDPGDKERGLLTPNGSAVVYSCRIDLLAVDAADEYWVVRHQIVPQFQALDALLRDEEAIAGCWSWEQDYIGMEVAGTIHNEIRIDGPLSLPDARPGPAPEHPVVVQHEPSGGGRSIPQHQRVSAPPPGRPDRCDQHTAGILRRTKIRRGRQEIAAAGALIAAEAIEMAADPAIYPTPGSHCAACDFAAPCLALFRGEDPQPLLSAQFHPRRAGEPARARLGQATWGFGRGAAPPAWL